MTCRPCSARAGSTSCIRPCRCCAICSRTVHRDARELVLGGQAVGRALGESGRHLPLEPGDPDLEELVEVAAEDAEELEPLEQRGARVERLVQYAAVELAAS